MFFLSAKLGIKSVICNSAGCFLLLSQIIDQHLADADAHDEYADAYAKVVHPYTEEDGQTNAQADILDTLVEDLLTLQKWLYFQLSILLCWSIYLFL